MITQEMIAKMMAAGMTPQQIAQLATGAESASPADAMLARIRSAPKVSDYDEGFRSDTGEFDGDYQARLLSAEIKNTSKGNVISFRVRIEASANPKVAVGSVREHSCYMWNNPAWGETQTIVQALSDLNGNTGDFTDEFYRGVFGEAQVAKHTLVTLVVRTAPQRNDPSKHFTRVRWRAPAPDGVSPPSETPAALTAVMGAAPLAAPGVDWGPKPEGWAGPWPPAV